MEYALEGWSAIGGISFLGYCLYLSLKGSRR